MLFTCAAGKAKHYCRHGVIDQGGLRGFEHYIIAEVGSYPHIFIDCPDQVLDLKVGVTDVKMITEDSVNNLCQVRSPVVPGDKVG